MALSLALGLGLQGAPKDYVDVYMARQKGKAAAEQKAAEAKAKKIDPYLQRMYKAMGDTYLPKDENLIFEEQANALKTAEDGDLNAATQAFSRVMANAAKAKSDYNLVTKVEGYRGADGTTEETLNDIKNTPDRAELATKLNSNPLSTFNVGPDGQLIYNGFKRVDVTKDIFQTLNQSAFYDPTAQTPIKFGEKNYIAIGLKPEAAQMLTQKFSSPDFKRSVYAEYGEKLKQLNTPPDFTTPAGIATFQKGADDFLATKVQEQFPLFSKLVPADGRKPSTFNFNMAGNQTSPAAPQGGNAVIVKVLGPPELANLGDKNNFTGSASGLSGTAAVNYKASLPISGQTFDLQTGKEIKKADIIDATYNQTDAYYTLKKDYRYNATPYSKTPNYITLKKGMIIPDDFIDRAKKEGVADVSVLTFGISNDGRTKFYSPVAFPNQSQLNALSKDERAIYESAIREREAFVKGVKSSLGGSSKPAAKAAAPTSTKKKTNVSKFF